MSILGGAPSLRSFGVGTGAWFVPFLFAVLSYLSGRDNYDNPEGRVKNAENLLGEYDFIVVGGGSAGAVVASRLSEDPRVTVLLLEAGGDETELSDVPALSAYFQLGNLDWKYKTEPQHTACRAMTNWRCNWPRGKVLGGSSVLNYMLYIRGNIKDYNLWAEQGNYGWSFEEVLPYFKKSEDNRNPYIAQNTEFHATGGPLTVQEAPWRTPLALAFVEGGVELGYPNIDLNGPTQTGFMLPQGTIRRGSRCSTAKAFLRPARNRPNLDIAMRSHVHRVLINNGRAVGVEFERYGTVQQIFAAKEVILSAGAVGSPHIMMLSGIGPKEHLESLGIRVEQDLPVGANLQDHIGIGGLTFVVDERVSLVQPRYENLPSILQYAMFGRGPLTVLGAIEGLSFINTKYANSSDDFPDIEFHFVSGCPASDGGRQIRRIHGLSDTVWEYYKPLSFKDTWTAFPTLLRPKSKGYIKLRSANPYEYPYIVPNYLTDDDDVRRVVDGLKLVVKLSLTPAFQRYNSRIYRKPFPGCEEYVWLSDAYLECVARSYTETIYHPAGTAKMGPHWDPEAVVDPELRVYGVSNLRVVDCSIMPTIVSGNTNAPVIMVAEKASDMIKSTWNLQL